MIPSGRLVSFYGDDFSGSTDVMEVLAANGLETVLFLDVPEERQLERFPNCRAFGIAGSSRSQSPAWMTTNLPRIFQALQQLQAPLCHYKICSTFDSSPQVGSIGRALEIGQEIFGSSYVPLVVGAPALRRYCVFGNLFATVGSETLRLDRHPTMSRHPVTPMAESDLRAHLAAQTSKPIGVLDILALQSGQSAQRLQRLLSQGSEVVLFDVLDESSLRQVGSLLWDSRSQQQFFIVGSSGVEYALTSWWRSRFVTASGGISFCRRNRPHSRGFGQRISGHGRTDSAGRGSRFWLHRHRRASTAGTREHCRRVGKSAAPGTGRAGGRPECNSAHGPRSRR